MVFAFNINVISAEMTDAGMTTLEDGMDFIVLAAHKEVNQEPFSIYQFNFYQFFRVKIVCLIDQFWIEKREKREPLIGIGGHKT